jgi:hypothetical protein
VPQVRARVPGTKTICFECFYSIVKRTSTRPVQFLRGSGRRLTPGGLSSQAHTKAGCPIQAAFWLEWDNRSQGTSRFFYPSNLTAPNKSHRPPLVIPPVPACSAPRLPHKDLRSLSSPTQSSSLSAANPQCPKPKLRRHRFFLDPTDTPHKNQVRPEQ